MVTAYMLIQTDVGAGHRTAEQIRRVAGVAEVVEVIGPYDVIARLEAERVEDLGRDIVGKIHTITGITRTQTCTVVQFD